MAKIGPFEKYADMYDAWFERNRFAYESELRAVATMLSRHGFGMEIGVGTGRFAIPLGIKLGVEPSGTMGAVARQRGVEVIEAVAEALPLASAAFDFALMVTTLCFLDDVRVSLHEARRVLKNGGSLIVGFIDGESRLGRLYQGHTAEGLFYREARFYSVSEVICMMEDAGFGDIVCAQTLFHDLHRLQGPEPVCPGHGQGSFVVLRGEKPADGSS